jgi:hypothetical protein
MTITKRKNGYCITFAGCNAAFIDRDYAKCSQKAIAWFFQKHLGDWGAHD